MARWTGTSQSEESSLSGGVQIGIGENDVGEFAAEFQAQPLQIRNRGAFQQFARAFGQSGLSSDFGKPECVERRQFRGLEHHGTAAGQRRGYLPGGGLQREIPGHNGGHHAHRFARGVVEDQPVHGNGFAAQILRTQPA